MKYISVVLEHPDKDQKGVYIHADPFDLGYRKTFQGRKIRSRLVRWNSGFEVIIKVNNSRFTQKISVSKILTVLRGQYVVEDDTAYILISKLELFLEIFSDIFVARKYKLPYQLNLPFHIEPALEEEDPEDLSEYGIIITKETPCQN